MKTSAQQSWEPGESDLQRARQHLYGFLAAALLNRPDPQMLEGLLSEPAMAALQTAFPGHPAAARLVRLAAAYRQGDQAAEEFLLDYEALFRVPGDAYTHPYESAYLGAGERDQPIGRPSLNAGRLRMVVAAYQSQGLSPSEDFDEPPDHIGVQLDFMSCLCGMAVEALDAEDTHRVLELLAAQESFLRQHLLAWGGDCLTKVERSAATELYSCLAGLGKSLLAQELEDHRH